jgi:ectoine hydroxylase-related dioxygenase (phytanoyl-CoA dioxygenase family)
MDDLRLSELYREYEKNGFAVLESVIDEELITAFEKEYPREKYTDVPPYASYIADRAAYVNSEIIRNIICHETLVRFLALSGQTYMLQMIEARRGSSQIDWHIDYFGADDKPWDEFVVVQVCLQDVTEESGPLEIIEGSHLWSTNWDVITNENCVAYSESCFEYYRKVVVDRAKEPRRFLCKRGDIVLWSGYAMHRGATPAGSSTERHSMVGRYNSSKNPEKEYSGRLKKHGEIFYIAN